LIAPLPAEASDKKGGEAMMRLRKGSVEMWAGRDCHAGLISLFAS